MGWTLPEQASHELQNRMAHALGEHLRAHFQHGRILWNKIICGFATVTRLVMPAVERASLFLQEISP